ncbi:MAG: helix-turn-helix domain-containing protein [Myroides sp.]
MTQIQLNQELNEIKKLIKDLYINNKDLLSSSDVLKILNISESLLFKLTSKKLLPHYKPTNGRLFFIKSELIDWVKEHRIHTEKDAEELLKKYRLKK